MSEIRERMLYLFVLFSSFVSFTFFLFHLALFVLPLLSITKEPKEIRENKGTNPLHYLHFQVIESFPRVPWCDLFYSINAMAVKGNGTWTKWTFSTYRNTYILMRWVVKWSERNERINNEVTIILQEFQWPKRLLHYNWTHSIIHSHRLRKNPGNWPGIIKIRNRRGFSSYSSMSYLIVVSWHYVLFIL